MSAYHEFPTTINDGGHLAAALRAMGFVVEVHDEAQALYGYHGDQRAQKANVIIRRQYVGEASNDIGFLKGADGTYGAIISNYDRHSYGDDWMGQVRQRYTEERQMTMARSKGYIFQGRETVTLPNGKQQVRLQFAAR